ncbi:hypothetical protein LFWB_3010 [Candidatus Phytoplasma luffae]|uniref:Effector n=1 Tax=Loofah witches'-broom phytoplasma TaxID=35773 RepID=A0A975INI0_LOWBP|nr:hypothetical protein [Candidatus Phytoplasma luffae]QTX02871.1 hypothetical protein LFWB_3010 [Candidatus Phytoplasma luffae]
MNNNFFQKHLVTIIITSLFGIAIIIGFYQEFNDYQNEKNYLSPLENKPQQIPSKIKRSTEETPQPKIKTTAVRLDQIKTYLFGEPTDTSKLPSDLSEREKTQINKLKNSWQLSLNLLKKEKTGVDEEQTKCDNYNLKIKEIKNQYPSLITKKNQLEQDQADKNKIINQKKEVRGQFKYLPNQPEEVRKKREENKRILEAEIDKLQDEEIKIVGEIGKIKVQIGILEADQEYYQDMLSGAENYKRILEERYKEGEKQYKDSIISGLNELYDITSAEE